MTRKERHSMFTTFVCTCPISSWMLFSFETRTARVARLSFVEGAWRTSRENSWGGPYRLFRKPVLNKAASRAIFSYTTLLAEDTQLQSYKMSDVIFIISIESLQCDFSLRCGLLSMSPFLFERLFFRAFIFMNQHAEINIENLAIHHFCSQFSHFQPSFYSWQSLYRSKYLHLQVRRIIANQSFLRF